MMKDSCSKCGEYCKTMKTVTCDCCCICFLKIENPYHNEDKKLCNVCIERKEIGELFDGLSKFGTVTYIQPQRLWFDIQIDMAMMDGKLDIFVQKYYKIGDIDMVNRICRFYKITEKGILNGSKWDK